MVRLTIPDTLDGQRLDRALAVVAEAEGLVLSRSRLTALLAEGAITGPRAAAKDKVRTGDVYAITLPPPRDPIPQPEDIALDIVHEDADLVVVNKPAGMVVHPAPGAESGTLVNALLAHCGDSLAGIGGERRPGIVHRIDKDTSGLLVVAKTELAHAHLSRLFAAHEIAREYTAFAWGAPDRSDPKLAAVEGAAFEPDGWLRIETQIDRDPRDRKKMAVRSAGRTAITRIQLDERFGNGERPAASLMRCRLETGRTHQIRVHAAHIGHALIGDPVYARPRKVAKSALDVETRTAIETFPRQALHATSLGFSHPRNGEILQFCADLPPDMHEVLTLLRRNM